MKSAVEISDTREFFGGMTSDGVAIVTHLMFIKPGDGVIYHVGNLPRDRSDPTGSYRMCDVRTKEINNIVWLAESVAAKGDCKLLVKPVTQEFSVYYAIGVDPRS